MPGMALMDSYSLGGNRHQNESAGNPNMRTHCFFINQFPKLYCSKLSLTIQHRRGRQQSQRLLVLTWAMKFIACPTFILSCFYSPTNIFSTNLLSVNTWCYFLDVKGQKVVTGQSLVKGKIYRQVKV